MESKRPSPPTLVRFRDAHVSDLKFSQREISVLQLVAQGFPNATIGRQLYIAEDTVKNHLRNMTRRAGTRDRTHLVVLALKLGILDHTFLRSLPIPVAIQT